MFKHFYHGTLRKYVIIFGNLFNNIVIHRVNSAGAVVQAMKVPLSYGPKDKFLARLDGDPKLNRPFAEILPRMAFEISSISYAPERKLNTLNRNVKADPNNKNQLNYNYQSVPYDIGFTLYIMIKNTDDGTRIVEQILPYFTPDWTITANIMPEMGMVLDIPIVLTNTILQDTYEGDFLNRRAIVWSLDFVMKGHLFGPVKKGNVIKTANVNFVRMSSANTENAISNTIVSEHIYIRPGLTANGQPTSNASESVAVSEIGGSDNYGFIIDFETDI